MKIIRAVNYGDRTVVDVVMNPDDPEWVHTIGAWRRDENGHDLVDDEGAPVIILSATVPPGETGETCHNCHGNWVYRQLVLDGNDQYTISDAGERRRKSSADIQAEVKRRFGPSSSGQSLDDALGTI